MKIQGFLLPIKSLQSTKVYNHKNLALNMLHESVDFQNLHSTIEPVAAWIQHAAAGIAENAPSTPNVCPEFGQPGWAPFCFLNGNPVFQAFDFFQSFVQNSVISLHDLLSTIGVQSYGLSIILFTIFVRILVFPLSYQQIASTQMIQALNPQVQQIREKFKDNKELQNQLVALLYDEAKTNPLAGCLPSLFQIPIFIALYRSFQNLASSHMIAESFLWLPNLEGPVYGARSTDWLTSHWNGFVPPLGWTDTLAFLTIPLLLYIAQSVSLKLLTPPSDDPQVQKSQQILKYLPLMLAYFSLSVPAGLGVYWITNNLLSTVTTLSVKEYFKRNPVQVKAIDIDEMVTRTDSRYYYPDWGFTTEEQVFSHARQNYRPSRRPIIPEDFEY